MKVTSLRPQSNIVNSVQTEEIYSDLGHTVDEDLTHAGPALTLDPGTNNSQLHEGRLPLPRVYFRADSRRDRH